MLSPETGGAIDVVSAFRIPSRSGRHLRGGVPGTPAARGRRTAFRRHVRARVERHGAARRTRAAAPLDGQEPGATVPDQRHQLEQPAGLRHRGQRLEAREQAVFPADVLGYPTESLAEIPAGTYQVQALLHRYETFHRADGHTVKLPPDRGEGQQWSKAPGNLYSTPREIVFDPKKGDTITIALDKVIPPIPDPPTTKYVKHERIRSERLSKFWGRDVYLGAHILLPEGFDAHPNARYPLVINHGHFPDTIADLPRGAARSEPEARLLRPLPHLRLQPDPAGVRLSALQGLDLGDLSALHHHRDPARQPVLRRLLRGELRQRGPVRGRHHLRADPLPREEVPRDRRRLGALHVRRLDGRLGVARRSDLLSRRVQRRVGGVSRPDRLPRVRRRQHLRGRERVLREGPLEGRHEARPPQLPRPHLLDRRADEPGRERDRPRTTRAGGQYDVWQAVYSPVGSDGYPKPIWDKRTGRHRQVGRGVLEGELRPRQHPEARLGQGPRQEARRQDPHLRRRRWTTTT